MAKKIKPVTPGLRFRIAPSFEEITTSAPEKSLLTTLKKSGGRTSVPQIFYKNHHIGGCDDLYKLEAENGLEIFID